MVINLQVVAVTLWSLCDLELTLTELLTINAAHSDGINDLYWSNLGDDIVSGGNDGVLRIWNSKSGKGERSIQTKQASISSCAYKNSIIVSTSSDGSVKVWQQAGNEIVTLLGHNAVVNACDFYFKLKKNPTRFKSEIDEVMLVTVDVDGSIIVWRPIDANIFKKALGTKVNCNK